MKRGLAAAVGLSLAACGASSSKPAAPAAPQVVAKNVTSPVGVTLDQACTPTGPELCFNAIDDNCNGVIDEGCSERTGVLQFVIAWDDTTKTHNGGADVDLVLFAPNDEKIQSQERARSTKSGFHLDRDCPTDGCGGQNVEDVYFDGAEPPKGHYVVELRLIDARTAELPVVVEFGARMGSRAFHAKVPLTVGEEKKTFAFDL